MPAELLVGLVEGFWSTTTAVGAGAHQACQTHAQTSATTTNVTRMIRVCLSQGGPVTAGGHGDVTGQASRPEQLLEVGEQRRARRHPQPVVEPQHRASTSAGQQLELHLGHPRVGAEHVLELLDDRGGAPGRRQADHHRPGGPVARGPGRVTSWPCSSGWSLLRESRPLTVMIASSAR